MKPLFWLTLVPSALVAAQQPALRGTVVSAETREPLGLTIVTLHPGLGTQFSDASGAFAFADIGSGAGTYLLSVRQIGYVPLDTQIVLRADVPTTLLIVMRRLAVELPAITVVGHTRCTTPGPPDREVTPALAAVFDQLMENARRLELLADSHPFRYRLERSQREVRRGDSLRAHVDTIDFDQNETRRRYRPGLVVTPGTGPYSGRIVVMLASLHELADSAFHQNHCFRLAGRDTIEGESLVRIDFEPVDDLGSSDIAGSAYLDSVSYGLRFTETRLTRPDLSELRSVRSVVARTRFRDIAPGIVLQDYVRAVWVYRSNYPTQVETQRLLGVRFGRPLPQE